MKHAALVVVMLAACSRNAAHRDAARGAPSNRVAVAINEASKNPAALELRTRGHMVRFSGIVAATGVDDMTIVEDRRAACAVFAGLGALGASLQSRPNTAYCESSRLSSRRVPYAVITDEEKRRGAIVCYMGWADEHTIAKLRIGQPTEIAGVVTRVTNDEVAGIVISAEDCIVPEN